MFKLKRPNPNLITGDPDDLVATGTKTNPLEDWRDLKHLCLLNLTYDFTPANLVRGHSMINAYFNVIDECRLDVDLHHFFNYSGNQGHDSPSSTIAVFSTSIDFHRKSAS